MCRCSFPGRYIKGRPCEGSCPLAQKLSVALAAAAAVVATVTDAVVAATVTDSVSAVGNVGPMVSLSIARGRTKGTTRGAPCKSLRSGDGAGSAAPGAAVSGTCAGCTT